MDENILKELFTYDILNIYNTVNIQCAFYCFYNYSTKRILELIDNEESFNSILELYELFLDTSLHSNISQLVEHLEEFENLEKYLVQLGKTLDVSLKTEDEDLQITFAKFLDTGVYRFLRDTIPEIHLFYREDNELDLEKLKKLLENKVTEFEDLEEPKKEEKQILKAFHIRKKTLRRKNITPMKSRSRLFKNKSIKK
jgi:hypothetical protein